MKALLQEKLFWKVHAANISTCASFASLLSIPHEVFLMVASLSFHCTINHKNHKIRIKLFCVLCNLFTLVLCNTFIIMNKLPKPPFKIRQDLPPTSIRFSVVANYTNFKYNYRVFIKILYFTYNIIFLQELMLQSDNRSINYTL